jgi:integrase
MARSIHRLSARTVASLSDSGYYADGGGLYLQVGATGTKSWIFRFTIGGRAREMGLGSLLSVSLATARSKAQECRALLQDGVDPIEARQTQRAASRLAAAPSQSFGACAAAYIEAHRSGWRNTKHADQWRNTLKTYADPVLGERSVQSIDTALIMKVLEPIWQSKTETASRVHGRIEAVLDWATVRGFRQGENPARWRGHLDHLLPERAKVQRVVHHPALPYDQMPDFMAALRAQGGVGARGLEFQILTAARTGEVIGARWDEFDEGKKLWTVPAARMKAGREHRVALSASAIAILTAQRAGSQSEFVFPGLRPGRPLSNMAFLQLLRRVQRTDLTAHGFRSTFRDWAAERTAYAREVVEMALAHTISDKVEAAYRRGDLFEKRCQLMEDWARHCGMPRLRAVSRATGT